MRHPTSRALFAYWDQLRGTRASPERHDIDPTAIRHILPDTFILAAENTDDPVFRLAGTRVCAMFGDELKGQSLASLWVDSHQDDVIKLTQAVMDDAVGVIGGISALTETGREFTLEWMLLPLRQGGKTHSRLIGSLSVMRPPVWLGIDPVVSLSTLSLRMMWPKVRNEEALDPLTRRSKLVVVQGGRML